MERKQKKSIRNQYKKLETYRRCLEDIDHQLDALSKDEESDPAYISSSFPAAIPNVHIWDGENVGFLPADEAIIRKEERYSDLIRRKGEYEDIIAALQAAIDETVEECPHLYMKSKVHRMLINVLVNGGKQDEQGVASYTATKYVNRCLEKASEKLEKKS